MLEQIKRATEVDADVIGDRLSAVENIRGQIIGGFGVAAVVVSTTGDAGLLGTEVVVGSPIGAGGLS
jgi:hypothetical protein